MRKLFSTFSALLLIQVAAFSQTNEVIITEILYNIPGNTEEVEFIELYNPSSSNTVTLNDYSFTEGVTFTFPPSSAGAITVAPNSYFVLTTDSVAYVNAFGVSPDATWSSGGLSNGGEDIVIVNNNGVVVDSVNYDDASPWPMDADGSGYSLQLCDLTVTDRNLATNWGTSNTFAGVVSTGDSIFATPGVANTCATAVVTPPTTTYPLYSIDMIDGLNADGVADSSGVTCELRGVAYCVNTRGSGLDFPFAQSDNSAGIRIYSRNDVSNYTHTAGDSLHIFGTVSQYNGLLQFSPDSIVLISQGIATPNAISVTQLSETTENKFVQLSGIHLVDTSEWTGTGSGFTVHVTDGSTDTLAIRIDNDVDLYTAPVPTGTFSITGWGGQYDRTAPYTDGYQLLPCGLDNYLNTTAVEAPLTVRVYPNPASNVLTVEAGADLETVLVYNALGQVVLSANNINTTSTQINTSDLTNGIYTISIVSGERVTSQLFQVSK